MTKGNVQQTGHYAHNSLLRLFLCTKHAMLELRSCSICLLTFSLISHFPSFSGLNLRLMNARRSLESNLRQLDNTLFLSEDILTNISTKVQRSRELTPSVEGNGPCNLSQNFTNCRKKNAVSWVVTPCGSCKNRRFRGTYRLHHQSDKNLQTTNVSCNFPV
jgi:hypothetical protein